MCKTHTGIDVKVTTMILSLSISHHSPPTLNSFVFRMQPPRSLCLPLAGALLPLATAVWPIPRNVDTVGDSSEVLSFSDSFTFESNLASVPRFNEIVDRAIPHISTEDGGSILTLYVEVSSDSTSLTQGVDSDSYNITIGSPITTLTANTIYGAMYGLETIAQLSTSGEMLESEIVDSPAYQHRAFMIDTGRRFVPVDLMMSQIDAMAIFKLNVLHLHFADWCRYAIESEAFPALTASLVGDQAGFYTRDEIRTIIDYANSRGIRVVPEVDLPGHGTWALPLLETGDMSFCTSSYPYSMLDDADNKTRSALEVIIKEVSEIFGDEELFHIGADETTTIDEEGCPLENIAGLESKMLGFITNLGKTPVCWEEGLFKSGGAKGFEGKATINAWNAGPRPKDIEAAGFDAIESMSGNFYLNNNPSFDSIWFDISIDDNPDANNYLRGGEVSMWTDDYCYELQCGAYGSNNEKPVGAQLYPPSMDKEFAQSFNGMVWPKAAIGAGAFWNFVEDARDNLEEYVEEINSVMIERGMDTCPSNCNCDYLDRCGKPYIN